MFIIYNIGIHDDKPVQIEYLKAAFLQQLPAIEISRATVDGIFNKGMKHLPQSLEVDSIIISAIDEPLSKDETIQVRALEWLSFDPIQRQDALFKCNRLMRAFLRRGKVNAAQKVVLAFPDLFNNSWLRSVYGEDAIVEDEHQLAIKAAVREQLDYRLLIKCIEGRNAWLEMFKTNPMYETKSR
jgi:hypothetical protein